MFAGASIIRLVGIEQACTMASTAIAECGAKLQVSTYATCDMVVQPDLGVANDGTFCEPMRAAQIGTPKGMSLHSGFFAPCIRLSVWWNGPSIVCTFSTLSPRSAVRLVVLVV